MRKYLSLLLSAFLILGFAVNAGAIANYASDNAIIVDGSHGPAGITPMTQIVKVRYGILDNFSQSLASGDVVSWDINSADGITITACVAGGSDGFAGVLVTTMATAESMTVRASDRNWGYMAIKGYCLAKVDTSMAASGGTLQCNGSTLGASFGTNAYVAIAPNTVSHDIGTLLNDTGADGLMPVWLK